MSQGAITPHSACDGLALNWVTAYLYTNIIIYRTCDTPPLPYSNTKALKTFDYTMIMDRLRTIIWSDNSHPTSVVTLRFKGPTFPLPATFVQSKGHTFEKLKKISSIKCISLYSSIASGTRTVLLNGTHAPRQQHRKTASYLTQVLNEGYNEVPSKSKLKGKMEVRRDIRNSKGP